MGGNLLKVGPRASEEFRFDLVTEHFETFFIVLGNVKGLASLKENAAATPLGLESFKLTSN